jgi:S-adenosylmethionine hydrolase
MQNNFSPSGIVTLLTDFGLADGYVAAMKGVILKHAPFAKIVDATHDIQAYGVKTALFVLEGIFPSFPSGTVHIVVVDPAVGSSRRHLLVKTMEHVFIGPDSGVPGAVARKHGGKVFEILAERLGVVSPSNTFHGRDIYAVAAGMLLMQKGEVSFLEPCDDPLTLDFPEPVRTETGFEGEVIHVDHFGNVITNLRPEHLVEDYEFILNGTGLGYVNAYFELPLKKMGVVLDSWGYYEICANQDSASDLSGLRVGSKILICKKKIKENQE